MALTDHQLGFADESTYGTAVTPVTRFFEFNSESIDVAANRTEGDPLRVGTYVKRSDRFTPYIAGAAGSISMDVLTKGFGYFLKHMVGSVATSGPAETAAYTHTGTFGDLYGKAFTCQVGRPFNPTGTVQPFTYQGGKVTEWTLSNSVDGNLMLELGMDFQAVATATGLSTASYPTLMDNLTWAGGVLTVGGSQVDVTDLSIGCNNNLNTDRRYISGSTNKKEPTSTRREVTFSFTADFDSLTHRNRVVSTNKAGALAQIVGTWTGPSLIVGATTLFPKLQVTIPAGRFDTWTGQAGGPDAIMQELSGVGLYDGTNSPITLAYTSGDVTP